MVKVDLHNHLGRNGANPGFDETIDIVAKKLDWGGMFGVVNDGPEDYRYERFIEQSTKKKSKSYERVPLGEEKRGIYVPEKDITVVGVEEVESKQGHFIVVGMPTNKKIQNHKKILDIETALTRTTYFQGINIPVHSFGKEGLARYLMKNQHLFYFFEGFEAYNASAEFWFPWILPKNANQKGIDFYLNNLRDNYNIGICAFTDGHSPEVIGTSYTKIEEPIRGSEEIFFQSLKENIKSNKSLGNLHMKPAMADAAKHAYNMIKARIFSNSAV